MATQTEPQQAAADVWENHQSPPVSDWDAEMSSAPPVDSVVGPVMTFESVEDTEMSSAPPVDPVVGRFKIFKN